VIKPKIIPVVIPAGSTPSLLSAKTPKPIHTTKGIASEKPNCEAKESKNNDENLFSSFFITSIHIFVI